MTDELDNKPTAEIIRETCDSYRDTLDRLDEAAAKCYEPDPARTFCEAVFDLVEDAPKWKAELAAAKTARDSALDFTRKLYKDNEALLAALWGKQHRRTYPLQRCDKCHRPYPLEVFEKLGAELPEADLVAQCAALSAELDAPKWKAELAAAKTLIQKLETVLCGAIVGYDKCPYQMATGDIERLDRVSIPELPGSWYQLDVQAVSDIAKEMCVDWQKVAASWMDEGKRLEAELAALHSQIRREGLVDQHFVNADSAAGRELAAERKARAELVAEWREQAAKDLRYGPVKILVNSLADELEALGDK